MWNIKVTTIPTVIGTLGTVNKGLLQGLEDLEIKGRVKTMKFSFNNYPQKSQIYHWVHKFQATRSANNFNKKAENFRSGRRLTVRSLDNVDAVRNFVGRSPQKSPSPTRRRSQKLGLSRAL